MKALHRTRPTTLSHKIQLHPTPQQQVYLRRACGVARFVWNWALERWRQEYEAGGQPSGLALKKQFNAIKGEHFPWVYEVTKYAAQQPFLHLQSAFRNFFAKRTRLSTVQEEGGARQFLCRQRSREARRQARLDSEAWLGTVRLRAKRFGETSP